VNNEPWIGGPATDGVPGTCTFAEDDDEARCGRPADIHILSESAVDGYVSLPTCERHAPIARHAGVYVAEHVYGPACVSAEVTLWRDEGCESVEQMVAEIESAGNPGMTVAEAQEMDEWLDGRDAWLADGIAKGYVCSDVRCATHDGEPLTPAEELIFEEGHDDPCIPIVRLADEPGQRFIPRFGPPRDLN
jgi:hypothetical protein